MNKNKILELLQSRGLLDITTLTIGLDRGWVNYDTITDFSRAWLHTHPTDKAEYLQLFSTNNKEIMNSILRINENNNINADTFIDKWKWAYLATLHNENITPEAKIDELEEIFADFGYPEDMRQCSKYGPSEAAIRDGYASIDDVYSDPLIAMKNLISKLQTQLGISQTS